jgi:hypothetical protein
MTSHASVDDELLAACRVFNAAADELEEAERDGQGDDAALMRRYNTALDRLTRLTPRTPELQHARKHRVTIPRRTWPCSRLQHARKCRVTTPDHRLSSSCTSAF